MTTKAAFWPETSRIIGQWIGIATASVLSGLLLGILSREGVGEKLALEIALPIGFLLALIFWVLIGYWFRTRTAGISVPVSSNVTNFEVQPATSSYSVAPAYTMASQVPS